MCCDGTLFSYVTLTSEDVLKLKKHPQLQLIQRGGQLSFDQPCALHDGKCCTQYADRPDTCSRYQCRVLQSVASDERTDFEAALVIQEARALVENVAEYVCFEPGMPMAVSTWEQPPEGLCAEGLVAWERAQAYLFEHFLGQPLPGEERQRRQGVG